MRVYKQGKTLVVIALIEAQKADVTDKRVRAWVGRLQVTLRCSPLLRSVYRARVRALAGPVCALVANTK